MTDEPNSKFPLNEPQERRLTIVLSRLEGGLRALRDDVLHPPENSPLIRYEDPIDPALAESLNRLATQAQSQVEHMAHDLGLQATAYPIRRAHLASLLLLNIDLYASHAKGLRGYGKVSPATADYLETELTKLEMLAGEITHVLENDRSDCSVRKTNHVSTR